MRKTMLTSIVISMLAVATVLMAGGSPRTTTDCSITVNGYEIRIDGSDGGWTVVQDDLGLESSGYSLCETLQPVLDVVQKS